MAAAQKVFHSPELMGIISESLLKRDVCRFRSVNRIMEKSTWHIFKSYFKKKTFPFTEAGLTRLLAISRDERFASEMASIKFVHKNHSFEHIDRPFVPRAFSE